MSCQMCGDCCRLFIIPLTEEEYRSGNYVTVFQELAFFTDFAEAEASGANLLAQKADGSCLYLQQNRCSIHQHRPAVCRPFSCDSRAPDFQEMIKSLKRNQPRLAGLND